jgi:hypothetical protein
MGIFRFFVCLFLLLLSAVSQADFTSNSGDNDQATSEIITMTGAAYAGDAMRTDAADVEAYLNSLVPGL